MSINVKSASRLAFARLLVVDGVEFWDTMVMPDSIPRPDDIQYIVRAGDRIDLLADAFYQDPAMWWVLAWANNLEILPTDLKENMQIRVPSRDFVVNEMLRNATRRA
jgi:hypothetical protein